MLKIDRFECVKTNVVYNFAILITIKKLKIK
jgi:hypothetical protein